MSYRELLTAFNSLPREAQRQVAELIELLKKQQECIHVPIEPNRGGLARQSFIGMWRDRDDMKDSSAWVRKTRQQEWSES